MNQLSIAESWIANELLSDSTLTGLVGSKVYLGSAPQEAVSPFIIFSYVDAEVFYNLGTKRDHGWAYYDIMSWQLGANTVAVKAIANRIDEMFSGFRNRTFTQAGVTYKFYSRSTRPISRIDDTEPPNVWRGLGGTYKISMTKQ